MAIMTAHELEMQMPDASQLLSDEPEMESSLHYMQLLLLVTCLEWAWQDRNDFFVGANLTLYFSRQQLKNRDFRGPDFFLVKNTTRVPRTSWVVWEEDGRYPDVIIELLSNSTAEVDRTLKRDLYGNRLHIPEYFYFSPETLEFAGFRLETSEYQPILANSQGWLWSEALGFFLGIHERKLRYFSLEGVLIPTPQEAAQSEILKVKQVQQLVKQVQRESEQVQKQAEHESQRAEDAIAHAQRLADKLRELNIDPDLI